MLTKIVNNLGGSSVLAVDAAWGAGKTTFIKMWAEDLRSEKFPVVEFNAWETDFSGDPFTDLLGKLTEGLRKENEDKSLKDNVRALMREAGEILLQSSPSLIQFIVTVIPGGSVLSGLVVRFIKKKLSNNQKKAEALKRFRKTLQETAGKLSESRNNKPLVVVIDELDRCRPTYAVELLEVAKHLFSVNHIVFVLTVNRAQLEHSVKALYGSDFDAQGYLRRFFDVDFYLPDPEREKFITTLLEKRQINDYLKRTKQIGNMKTNASKQLMNTFFGLPYLSIRQIEQAIHRLDLVLKTLNNVSDTLPFATIVTLIVRTIDPKLYHQFAHGDVSDILVRNTVYKHLGVNPLQQEGSDEGWYWLFEVTLAKARQAISDSDKSELLQEYEKINNSSALVPNTPLEIRYAKKFLNGMNVKGEGMEGLGNEFKTAMQRLELLSIE